MLRVDEAQKTVMKWGTGPTVEKVSLDKAVGRTLGQTLCAPFSLPPFDRSMVDGYAVNTAGLAEEQAWPVRLRVVGVIPAGANPVMSLGRGEAYRILTGAMLPGGADAVTPQEETALRGDIVEIRESVPAGKNVNPRGGDLGEGDLLAEAGTVLTPGGAGLLAAAGIRTVPVTAVPRVVLLVTGSELAEPGRDGEHPPVGKIPGSNLFLLRALVEAWGGQVVMSRTIPDEVGKIAAALKEAAAESPALILTCGGVASGDFDLVPASLEKAGAELLFHGVAMRPGNGTLAARLGKTIVIGLSGSPMGAWVGAEVLARPVLAGALGRKTWERPVIKAGLRDELKPAREESRYVTCHLVQEDGDWVIRLHRGSGPGSARTLPFFNGLLALPPGTRPVQPGVDLPVGVITEQWGYS